MTFFLSTSVIYGKEFSWSFSSTRRGWWWWCTTIRVMESLWFSQASLLILSLIALASVLVEKKETWFIPQMLFIIIATFGQLAFLSTNEMVFFYFFAQPDLRLIDSNPLENVIYVLFLHNPIRSRIFRNMLCAPNWRLSRVIVTVRIMSFHDNTKNAIPYLIIRAN